MRSDVVSAIVKVYDKTTAFKPELVLIKREKLEDGTIHYSTHFDSEVSEALKAKTSRSNAGTGKSRAIWYNTQSKTEHKPADVFESLRNSKGVTDTMRNKADKYRQWELLLQDLQKIGYAKEYEHRK